MTTFFDGQSAPSTVLQQAQELAAALAPSSGEGPPSDEFGLVGTFYTDIADPDAPIQYGPKLVTGWGPGRSLVGPPGPKAIASYLNLTALKAADPDVTASYSLTTTTGPQPYAYVPGNFVGQSDDLNVVKLDTVPLTLGALVRLNGTGVNYDGRSVFGKLTDHASTKDATFGGGAIGDGFANDTAPVQTAFTAKRQGGALDIPNGSYAVSNIDTGRCESTFNFYKSELKALSTTPQDSIVKFAGLHTRITNIKLNGNFKANYGCAMQFYNAFESAQHNSFSGLDIHYAKIGLVYGEMPGKTATYYAQSENTISDGHWRGCEICVYSNHPNGYLFLGQPQLVAHAEEWPTGTFNTKNNRAFKVEAGHIVINSGEIQNTIADVVDGYAAEITGGRANINDCICEVNVPYLVKGGEWYMSGGRTFNTQSGTSQFTIPSTADVHSVIAVSFHQFIRNVGTGGFSNAQLVKNAGSDPKVRLSFDNCEIIDWTNRVPLVADNAQSVRFTNTLWVPNGSVPADRYLLDTTTADLLDRRDLDRTGSTTDGWFPLRFNGPFENLTYGLNSDVPDPAFANSLAFRSNKPADGDSEGGYFAVDSTSLASIKQTAIRARAGDRFLLEAWVKNVDAALIGLSVAMFDAAGALADTNLIVIASNGAGGFVNNTWRYVRQVCVVPASTTAFIAPGVDMKNGEGRFCGLEARRADWSKR